MGQKQTLHELMKAANITQVKLAELLNVTQPRISQILNPNSDPKLSTLRELSDVLGVGIDVVAAHYKDRKADRGDSTEN
jgi:transcriptional regulator with XRE-family HTH domain